MWLSLVPTSRRVLKAHEGAIRTDPRRRPRTPAATTFEEQHNRDGQRGFRARTRMVLVGNGRRSTLAHGPRRQPRASPCVEPIQPLEHGERFLGWRTPLDGGQQQAPRFGAVAVVERRHALLEQFFRLALALGERAARAFDIGAGTRVAAIEKQRPRPDIDGRLVLRGEIVIEADEEQLLDLRITIRFRRDIERA